MPDEYTEFMKKMIGILVIPIDGFFCVEQMLLYHLVDPKDKAGRDYIKNEASKTAFDSYTKSGKGHRSIKGLLKHVRYFSSFDLGVFLSDINDDRYEEYAFGGNLEYNIRASFGDVLDTLGEANDIAACASLLERICYNAKNQKRKSRSLDVEAEDAPDSESGVTNIYNQTLFYTDGGNINVIGNIEHVDSL